MEKDFWLAKKLASHASQILHHFAPAEHRGVEVQGEHPPNDIEVGNAVVFIALYEEFDLGLVTEINSETKDIIICQYESMS